MADSWIGVDFDGTLAKYTSWKGADHAGAPVKKMVDRVKKWLAAGKDVRIFTARVGPGTPAEEKEQSRKVIDDFCQEQFGQKLKITATKDHEMEELWDDRAVEVEKNTGEVVEAKIPKGQTYHVKPGDRVWFEYRCNESHTSSDAHLWYRSHRRVEVVSLLDPGGGKDMEERGENGMPATYKVRFDDGYVDEATEDELMRSRKEFNRPAPPRPPKGASLMREKVATFEAAKRMAAQLLEADEVTPEDADFSKVGSEVQFYNPWFKKYEKGRIVYIRDDGFVQIAVNGRHVDAVVKRSAIMPVSESEPDEIAPEEVLGAPSVQGFKVGQAVVADAGNGLRYRGRITDIYPIGNDWMADIEVVIGLGAQTGTTISRANLKQLRPWVAEAEEDEITPEDVASASAEGYQVGQPVSVDTAKFGAHRGRIAKLYKSASGHWLADVECGPYFSVGGARLSRLRPLREELNNTFDEKGVDAKGIVRHFLDEAMPPHEPNDDLTGQGDLFHDPSEYYSPDLPPLRKPDWPEFANVDDARFAGYLATLPVIYVDEAPYYLDDGYLWIIPLREKGEPMRWDDELEMWDFLDAHKQPGSDLWSHSHQLKDTETASIPMSEKEGHVVYRSGDYAFLRMPEDEEWIRKEGTDMQHCLAYAQADYCKRMRNAEIQLYSMTDTRTGIPVVDIELAMTRSSYGGPVGQPTVTQLRGIRNECPPRDQYLETLADFFENYGKDWKLEGVRSFDGRYDGEEFLRRLNELRGAQGVQESEPAMVPCPVCEGTKISKVTGQSCTRCEGTGQITAELRDRLASIKSDLTSRVLGLN